ncbi:hypothetical protein R3W88_029654 [Solanum pinnatisectum]|uniref:Uncharacterized protein n=1 Tax=Solanum pinnatisectum TaxID=50273 RepID=A0AAV9K675_9SOLN|nr:hypothetical protein R3W88_029654 [Solanum pinnatisectum]
MKQPQPWMHKLHNEKSIILSNVQKGEVVDNEKAIMIIPNVVQIGETNSINVFSLNRVLLDIADISKELQDYLLIEEDASPRLLESSKREKKQGNGEDNQPVRV